MRRRLPWSIRAPPRILSCSAVCASCGSLQRFMMLTSASGIFFAEHNTLADALSRWDNTSSQTQFAQATTALGISYVFEEIPGDFCYFDVDWFFFAFVIVFWGVCFLNSIIQTFMLYFSGIFTTVSSLDAFAQRFVHLAFAPSTHKNIKSHVNVYTRFCHSVRASPFPVQIDLLIRYVAYLTLSGRTYATIINHIGSLKHVNQLLVFGKVWDTHYRRQLVLRGVKRYLGVSPNRKHPITPEILLQVYSHFTFRISL